MDNLKREFSLKLRHFITKHPNLEEAVLERVAVQPEVVEELNQAVLTSDSEKALREELFAVLHAHFTKEARSIIDSGEVMNLALGDNEEGTVVHFTVGLSLHTSFEIVVRSHHHAFKEMLDTWSEIARFRALSSEAFICTVREQLKRINPPISTRLVKSTLAVSIPEKEDVIDPILILDPDTPVVEIIYGNQPTPLQ